MVPAAGMAGLLLMLCNIAILRAAPPTAGDLMPLVAGASASNTTGSIVAQFQGDDLFQP